MKVLKALEKAIVDAMYDLARQAVENFIVYIVARLWGVLQCLPDMPFLIECLSSQACWRFDAVPSLVEFLV